MTGTGTPYRVPTDRPPAWRAWSLPPLATGYAAALVISQGGAWPALLGPLGWWLVGAVAVTAVLVTGGSRLGQPDPRTVGTRRARHALRIHTDPGPGLRQRADRQALELSAQYWSAPFLLLVPLLFLDTAPWDRPVLAGVAFAVVVVAFAALALTNVRAGRDARRWLADPPGPRRALPAGTSRQRWTPAVMAVAGACIVASSVIGLVAD